MRWLAWLAMALFVGVATAAPYMSQELLYRWTASTGPVEQYQCELADGTLLLTPTAEISFRPRPRTMESIRCRALDIEGNTGPWSNRSDSVRVYTLPADSTGDGRVSAGDFLVLSKTFLDEGWEIRP